MSTDRSRCVPSSGSGAEMRLIASLNLAVTAFRAKRAASSSSARIPSYAAAMCRRRYPGGTRSTAATRTTCPAARVRPDRPLRAARRLLAVSRRRPASTRDLRRPGGDSGADLDTISCTSRPSTATSPVSSWMQSSTRPPCTGTTDHRRGIDLPAGVRLTDCRVLASAVGGQQQPENQVEENLRTR